MIVLFWLVVSLILANIPLTNLLGYESAAIMGIVVSISVIIHQKIQQKTIITSSLEAYYAQYEKGIVVAYTRELQRYMVWLLPSFGIFCLNALWVPNCDMKMGLWFWLLIPPVSMAMALLWVYVGRSVSRKWGITIATAVLVGEFFLFLWNLAWEPPIAGYSWTFGWFAGSIYDEALNIPFALVWYRAQCVLLVVGVLLGLEWLWCRYTSRNSTMIPQFFVLFFAGYGAMRVFSTEFDVGHTQDSVQQILGASLETEHFVVYFDPNSIDEDQRYWLQEDLEFRYHELHTFFQRDVVAWKQRKIGVYIYPNTEVQQRLMGARNTLVARPWTHQMHIRWTFSSSSLAHEMAHLFTAEFASRPTFLSTAYGVIPNLGLIEGIAVAADWPADEVSPHDIAAALHKANLAPNLLVSLSPSGFWKQPAGKAYQTMGSFVRWLVDTHGIEKFTQVYALSNFKEVYGLDIIDLHRDWLEFITQLPITQDVQDFVEYRYNTKSIFEKMCARKVAETQRVADNFYKQGRYEQAKEQYQQLEQWNPSNWKYPYQIAKIAMEQNVPQDTENILLAQENREHPAIVWSLWKELEGDLAWKQGDFDRAVTIFDSITQQRNIASIAPAQWRQYRMKRELCATKNSMYQQYFDTKNNSNRLWLASHMDIHPEFALYLQVFNWFQWKNYSAIREIVSTSTVSMQVLPQPLREEYHRMLLYTYWYAEDSVSIATAIETTENLQLQSEFKQRYIWKYVQP